MFTRHTCLQPGKACRPVARQSSGAKLFGGRAKSLFRGKMSINVKSKHQTLRDKKLEKMEANYKIFAVLALVTSNDL